METHDRIFAVFDQLDSALKTLNNQNVEITEKIHANEQAHNEFTEKQKESIQQIETTIAKVNGKCEYLENVWKQESIDNNDIRRDQNSLLIEIQMELESLRKKHRKLVEKIDQLQTAAPQNTAHVATTTKKCCCIQ